MSRPSSASGDSPWRTARAARAAPWPCVAFGEPVQQRPDVHVAADDQLAHVGARDGAPGRVVAQLVQLGVQSAQVGAAERRQLAHGRLRPGRRRPVLARPRTQPRHVHARAGTRAPRAAVRNAAANGCGFSRPSSTNTSDVVCGTSGRYSSSACSSSGPVSVASCVFARRGGCGAEPPPRPVSRPSRPRTRTMRRSARNGTASAARRSVGDGRLGPEARSGCARPRAARACAP